MNKHIKTLEIFKAALKAANAIEPIAGGYISVNFQELPPRILIEAIRLRIYEPKYVSLNIRRDERGKVYISAPTTSLLDGISCFSADFGAATKLADQARELEKLYPLDI